MGTKLSYSVIKTFYASVICDGNGSINPLQPKEYIRKYLADKTFIQCYVNDLTSDLTLFDSNDNSELKQIYIKSVCEFNKLLETL